MNRITFSICGNNFLAEHNKTKSGKNFWDFQLESSPLEKSLPKVITIEGSEHELEPVITKTGYKKPLSKAGQIKTSTNIGGISVDISFRITHMKKGEWYFWLKGKESSPSFAKQKSDVSETGKTDMDPEEVFKEIFGE